MMPSDKERSRVVLPDRQRWGMGVWMGGGIKIGLSLSGGGGWWWWGGECGCSGEEKEGA